MNFFIGAHGGATGRWVTFPQMNILLKSGITNFFGALHKKVGFWSRLQIAMPSFAWNNSFQPSFGCFCVFFHAFIWLVYSSGQTKASRGKAKRNTWKPGQHTYMEILNSTQGPTSKNQRKLAKAMKTTKKPREPNESRCGWTPWLGQKNEQTKQNNFTMLG